MGNTHPANAGDSEAEELVRLCRTGKLYELEKWIKDGKSLEIAATTKVRRQRALLEIAVETGFHSLVELAHAVVPETVNRNASRRRHHLRPQRETRTRK
jgi:hypothetical protein